MRNWEESSFYLHRLEASRTCQSNSAGHPSPSSPSIELSHWCGTFRTVGQVWSKSVPRPVKAGRISGLRYARSLTPTPFFTAVGAEEGGGGNHNIPEKRKRRARLFRAFVQRAIRGSMPYTHTHTNERVSFLAFIYGHRR